MYYDNIWNVTPGKYALFIGDNTGNRNRISYKGGYSYADIENVVLSPTSQFEEYLTADIYNLNDNNIQNRVILTVPNNGIIVFTTSNQSGIIPAYCIKLS